MHYIQNHNLIQNKELARISCIIHIETFNSVVLQMHQISQRQIMKKTFALTHPKIKTDRLIEAARADIKKYLKRERSKELPEGVDFWDFDCKFGPTITESKKIHVAEIGLHIDSIEEQALEAFYIEILAKPGHRTKKPTPLPTPESFTSTLYRKQSTSLNNDGASS
jgi:hypothetical protein